tara:strand:- start:376 stop:1077 length:702 start_codon:yes stop_codon:yes gene_type:complete
MPYKSQTRFITSIRSVERDNITSIILAAGAGYRMKSYGPKCLLRVGEKTIIEHQIHNIRTVMPKGDIIVSLGFECDRVMRHLPLEVRVVENQLHEETNTAESLRLSINNGIRSGVLVIHGDLVFNTETLSKCDYTESFILYDTKDQFKESEVGVTVNKGLATRMGYGLKDKWAQISYFTGKELKLLRSVCKNRERSRMYTFEIINEVLDSGGQLRAVEPEDMQIKDIDSSKDL